MEENEKIEKKGTKTNKVITIIMIVSAIVILGCGGYLLNSYRLLKKYDVNSFKLEKFEIPTFNSAVKSKKKLVAAFERGNTVTLKYDIKKIHLDDVYAYLEKLSSEGYIVVNLEDLYMRVVKLDDNIQIKITIGSNHLVFDYNIGIDYDEESKTETSEKTETE